MGVRRLLSLIRGLPASARVWHDTNGGWTIGDYFAATQLEMTHAVMRAVYASIPMAAHKRPKIKPLVVPRPGVETGPRKVTPGELFAVMRG